MASGAASQALAIGVPDARLGQSILLVAIPKGDNHEARLRDYFSRELPAFMMPSRIVWRAELPLSPNGKLDRSALERDYA